MRIGLLFDLALGAVILLLAVLLAQSISEKPESSLTELYFTDHSGLPSIVDTDIPVSFTVHSLENARKDYQVNITAELYFGENNSKNISLDSVSFALDHDGYARLERGYQVLDGFSRIKVKVSLVSGLSKKEISYWAKSESYVLEYQGLGNGTTECLTQINYIQNLDKVSITASGTYASGYPIMQVWLDGRKIGEYAVQGAARFDIPAAGGAGMHILDIAFINDLYDKASGDDRNLYIEQVFSNSRPLRPSVIESGRGIRAFDCLDLAKGLQSEGAARYRIMVGGPR